MDMVMGCPNIYSTSFWLDTVCYASSFTGLYRGPYRSLYRGQFRGFDNRFIILEGCLKTADYLSPKKHETWCKAKELLTLMEHVSIFRGLWR